MDFHIFPVHIYAYAVCKQWYRAISLHALINVFIALHIIALYW